LRFAEAAIARQSNPTRFLANLESDGSGCRLSRRLFSIMRYDGSSPHPGGHWSEMLSPEDQLPDDWMPREFFDYWLGRPGFP
jgi:hypothetical protein